MEMTIKLTTSGEQFGKNQVEKCAKKMDKLESREKFYEQLCKYLQSLR